jgi:hypothetical protein
LSIAVARVSNDDLAEEELGEWTRRSGTSAEDVDYIRGRLATALSPSTAMSLRADGASFRWLWPVITLVARNRLTGRSDAHGLTE